MKTKATNETLAQRLHHLRDAMRAAGLQSLLLYNEVNRRYITGFTGSTAWAIVTHDHAWLITDGRYWERAQAEAPHFELIRVTQSYAHTLRDVLEQLSGPAGFEAQTITVDLFDRILRPVEHLSWEKADHILTQLRRIKTPPELKALRHAAAITDQAMHVLPTLLRVGIRERELAWELEKYMREHGAEGLAFPIIVAFGENSALPHAEPGDRALREEMPITVDMGARVHGYCADLTRSFWYGRHPDPQYLHAWRATRLALTAALVGIRPQLTGRHVDALARDILGQYGYRAHFLHSLGHGVGLEIHESPRLGKNSDDHLQPGMVFTLEPGVYIPHRWGIRLEEFVVLWDNGPEIISKAPMWPVLTQ